MAAMTGDVHEGELHGGLPVLRCGQGPPLVVLSGLTATHENPAGWARRFELDFCASLVEFFTVSIVNRKPDLDPATTMADLARDVAESLRYEFAEPVPVFGVSTGGSIALQTAVDHPEVINRLVIAAAACRLSERGRAMQQQLMLDIAADRPRHASSLLGEMMPARRTASLLLGRMMWLANVAMDPVDPSDVLVTLAAEDGFDVCADLHRIAIPTLVVGGEGDRLYSPELFERTATGVAHGRLFLVPGGGHGAPLTSPDAREHVLDFFLEEELAHLVEHSH